VNPVLQRAGYEHIATTATGSADDAMRRYELAMMVTAARSKQ
jgi:hypothetical protein